MTKEKTVKLTSKVCGVTVASVNPQYKYFLKELGSKIEVPESHAEKLLQNPDLFEEAGIKVKKEKKAKKEVNLDLDGDGDFDKDDKRIAGKVLGSKIE